jgi:hypothetical protein
MGLAGVLPAPFEDEVNHLISNVMRGSALGQACQRLFSTHVLLAALSQGF